VGGEVSKLKKSRKIIARALYDRWKSRTFERSQPKVKKKSTSTVITSSATPQPRGKKSPLIWHVGGERRWGKTGKKKHLTTSKRFSLSSKKKAVVTYAYGQEGKSEGKKKTDAENEPATSLPLNHWKKKKLNAKLLKGYKGKKKKTEMD